MQKWVRIASEAWALLDTGEFDSESAMARNTAIAKSLGTTRQSLSNSLQAMRFASLIKEIDREAAERLMKMPATNVNTLSRWWRHDPDATLEEILSPTTRNSRELVRLELAARIKSGGDTHTALETVLQLVLASGNHALGSSLQRALECYSITGIQSNAMTAEKCHHKFARSCGISWVLKWSYPAGAQAPEFFQTRLSMGPYPILGLVEISGELEGEGLMRAVKAALPKALMATSVYPVVAIVASDGDQVNKIEAALPRFPHDQMGLNPSEGWRLADALGIVVVTQLNEIFSAHVEDIKIP